MRPDTVPGELADLFVAVACVAHADHALAALVIILGGVKQTAVGRKHTMTEEVAVGLGREPNRLANADGHGNPETSWPAGEGHPFAAARTQGDVVTAARQRDSTNVAVIEIEQPRGISPVVVLARRGKALRREGRSNGLRHRESRGGACEADEKRAAVELHGQCPSINRHPWR